MEEHERQLKETKGITLSEVLIFNYLGILLGLKFSAKFNCPDSRNITKEASYTLHLKVYGVAMAQHRDNDKLLVQTIPQSLTRTVPAWFTKIEIMED